MIYWQKIRQQILQRDEYTCQICLKKFDELDVHHVIPKRRNGLDSINNLTAVCVKCHELIELNATPKISNIKYKIIKISDRTHTRLNKIGLRNETFDDIVNRILDIADGKTATKK